MDFKALLAGLIFALVWASAFTSARIIVEAASPTWALAVRFLISGGIGVGLALILGQSFRLTRAQWTLTVVFGLAQNVVYLGLNFLAMQSIEASLAAIIASAMPLLVALANWSLFGERTRPWGIFGLVLGMLGVITIMGSRLQTGADLAGVVMCIVAVIALAVATLAVRGASTGGNLMMIVGLQMLVGSAVLWPIALLFEPLRIDPSWQLAAAFAYTVLLPGLGATFVWFWLVGRLGAVKASTFHFLNPFFGVAIAAVLLGERMTPTDWIGVAMITVGIFAVQTARTVVPRQVERM